MDFERLDGGIEIARASDWGEDVGVRHVFTTRIGGVSRPPFATLNLALHVGDDPAAVLANRRALCAAIGVPLESLVLPEQVHGTRVAVVDAGDAGRGALDAASALASTDGMATSTPGVFLVVLVADCVPVLLYDVRRRAVGVAHAGWRGSAGNVTGRLVETLVARLACRTEDLRGIIGPSIGPDDYEVGPDVVARFADRMPDGSSPLLAPTRAGRARLDLWRVNARQLVVAGLRPEHVRVAGISTFRDARRFFSYRRDGSTGRTAAGIAIAP